MSQEVVSPATAPLNARHAGSDEQTPILRLIAAFKLVKAILLLLLAMSAIGLMHRDVAAVAGTVLRHVRADPDSRFLHALITKLSGVSPRKLELFGVGAFVYSTLFFIEGIGLLLTRRWAEWMAVITTGGFIPLELFECVHHPHVIRFVVFFVNVAIVIYLLYELRRKAALLRVPKGVV